MSATRVWEMRSRLLASLTQPRRPFATSVVITPSQRPRRSATARVVGDPNSVLAPSRATTFPCGRARTRIVAPRLGRAISCPGGRWVTAEADATASGCGEKGPSATPAVPSGAWPAAGRARSRRTTPIAASTATAARTCGGR